MRQRFHSARRHSVVTAYLAHLAARVLLDDYDAQALAVIKSDLARFEPFVTGHRSDLDRFFLANPQIKARGTRYRIVREIVACWNWAVDEALTDSQPYRRPRGLACGKSPPRREAENAEYIAMMRGGGRELRRALYFLRHTGCRPKEMRTLRWASIHWSQRLIVLAKHKTQRRTGKPREVGIDARLLRLLRNLFRQAKDKEGLVFGPWHGRCSFFQLVRRTRRRLGLGDVTAAMFRNTWTGRAYEAELSERDIADQLGHTTTALVHHYGHQRDKQTRLPAIADRVMRRRK